MGWAETFVRDGLVVVEGALDPRFCEEVVARRLASIGVDEADPSTWRQGWHRLPVAEVYPFETTAPMAAAALFELVGGEEALEPGVLHDGLLLNFPSPGAAWWAPNEWDAPGAGWHKDGNFFRHFLDSPEVGVVGIIFWRDVTERQGPTYVVRDSIPEMARFLAQHPEGVDPGRFPISDILSRCQDFRPLTGSQGTIVWAHPFLLHSASVNATNGLRIISNMRAILREPIAYSGPGERSPVARAVLEALAVDELDFCITGERADAR